MTSTTRPRTSTLLAAAILLASAVGARRAAADTVVQVNVDSLLNGRTVSTVSGTTITPWTVGQGVDQNGNGDGYVTNAVEAMLVGTGTPGVALPNDGLFAENTRHPAVQLHFSNAAPTTSMQTLHIYQQASQGPQMFEFNVPQATYSKMFVLITASEGAAKLAVTLNYAGGVAPATQTLMLPDYGVGGATNPNDAVFFNLIAGMKKWDKNDKEGDGPSHTITGIELHPTGMLTSIKVEKMNGSYCVFWGATGIATSAVTTGAGGSAGGGTDGGAAGSSADAGGTAGSTGAGGAASGAAGSTGAAGAASGAAGSTGAAGAASGAAGSTTGAAGSTTGAAGSTTGAAGSTTGTTGAAGAGTKHSSGGGGCALAGTSSGPTAVWLLFAAALAIVVMRRKR